MKLKQTLFLVIALVLTFSLPINSNAQKRKAQAPKKDKASQKGSLSIEAGIVFTSGDTKPVARVEFYLIDVDAENILKETYGESINLRSIALDLDYPLFNTNGVQKAFIAINPHIITSATTDFQGKAKLSSIKVGNYYLFGFTKVGKSVVIWNFSVVVKSGMNSIILDNKNAALVFNG